MAANAGERGSVPRRDEASLGVAAIDLREAARLEALRQLEILDTGTEPAFEHIVHLVQQVLHVPICAVSLVDQDRQWFKARCGLKACETSIDVSFCAHTIRQHAAFVIEDAQKDARFRDNALVTGDPFIRAYAGIPLQTRDGFNIGSLCAIDTKPRVFSAADLKMLESSARQAMDEMELRAALDPLTGALSRRAWRERAVAEFRRARTHARPLSLAILNLDRLRQINDSYGRNAGDLVIQHMVRLCPSEIRRFHVFGRLGEAEFAMLLPETHAEDAIVAAERLRASFAAAATQIGQAVFSTVSIGVAGLLPGDMALDTLYARAERALRDAKAAGRNHTRLGLRRQLADLLSEG